MRLLPWAGWPVSLRVGARSDAVLRGCPVLIAGVDFSRRAAWPGPRRGVAREGLLSLVIALPFLADQDFVSAEEAAMDRVIIGADPHKRR